jgi:hypothetical protein
MLERIPEGRTNNDYLWEWASHQHDGAGKRLETTRFSLRIEIFWVVLPPRFGYALGSNLGFARRSRKHDFRNFPQTVLAHAEIVAKIKSTTVSFHVPSEFIIH